MNIPNHIGFIMDGNRRWAHKRGLTKSDGHKKGFEQISDVLETCNDLGIPIVSVYCWSTENWSRPAEEVNYIMSALEEHLPRFANELNERGFRFVHSGRRERIPAKTMQVIDQAVALTKDNGPSVLNLLFNYGGRAELVDSVKKIIKENVSLDQISETTISKNLWACELPDVDLVIRTGGDKRLSNFMLWQTSKACIYVTDTFWPDISRKDITSGIRSFNK